MKNKNILVYKRVGFLHYTLPPAISGVEIVIRDHARILSTSGYKVFLLGASGKKFRNEITVEIARSMDPKNKKVLKVQSKLKKGQIPPSFDILKQNYEQRIRKWIQTNKIEVIIVHNLLSRHYNLALTAAVYELSNKMPEVKWVNWIHDSSFLDSSYTKVPLKLKKAYPWSLLNKYQPNFKYVTISETRKNELTKLFGNNDITVVPNGLDINKMLPLPIQTRVLFSDIISLNPTYIGLIPVRIAARKNIEYAISIARIAKEKYDVNFVFMVTGALHLQNPEATKYYDFLVKKIKKENLESNFFFLSNYSLSNGDKFDIHKLNIRDLYLISDFLFLPSKSEGFGLPIIEAGFMRLPIFVSNIPVFKEVGNGYINVLSLNKKSEDNLKIILNYLQHDRSTLFHAQILNKYSLQRIVEDKIITLINSL